MALHLAFTMSQPPGPFPDFDFALYPALPNLYPPPPPLPPSAGLFSPSETTDLFGFLDNFTWEFENEPPFADDGVDISSSIFPYPETQQNTPLASSSSHGSVNRSSPSRKTSSGDANPYYPRQDVQTRSTSHSMTPPASASTSIPSPASTSTADQGQPRSPSQTRADQLQAKTLLSSPQKRLNHIMSEQKRRNAIRDGYAQLITLMAPEGTRGAIGMPTRGRPKGSGNRGRGKSQGKSGVLFRAVEYCRWLEEGRDALREEVLRLESAAGIHTH